MSFIITPHTDGYAVCPHNADGTAGDPLHVADTEADAVKWASQQLKRDKPKIEIEISYGKTIR